MQMNIQILSVTVENKPNAKGSYQQAEVAYKDLKDGKVGSKKLMSFTNKDVFTAAAAAKPGEQYTVTLEKGEKYWDWTNMAHAAPGASLPNKPTPISTTPVKTTYETPEERAARQVLIVKQSSLSCAVAVLNIGAKSPVKTEDILNLAQQFTDWVFSKNGKIGANALIDMPNDLDNDNLPE